MKQNTTTSEVDLPEVDQETALKVKSLNKAGVPLKLISSTLDLSPEQVKDVLSPKPKTVKPVKVSREEKYSKRRDEDIEKMKLLRSKGYSVYVVANTIGVPANDVAYYTKGIVPKTNIRDQKRHLSPDDLNKLKELLDDGFRPDQIARFLKCTEICVKSNMDRLGLKHK